MLAAWGELQPPQAKLFLASPRFVDRQLALPGIDTTKRKEHVREIAHGARDMVIGMTFVTLEGKTVQTGGMVVKNVAGLDMAKMIPPETRTFVLIPAIV